jgi:hypothetical protein
MRRVDAGQAVDEDAMIAEIRVSDVAKQLVIVDPSKPTYSDKGSNAFQPVNCLDASDDVRMAIILTEDRPLIGRHSLCPRKAATTGVELQRLGSSVDVAQPPPQSPSLTPRILR